MGMGIFEQEWSMDAAWVMPILEAKGLGLEACEMEIQTGPWVPKRQLESLINELRVSLMAEK